MLTPTYKLIYGTKDITKDVSKYVTNIDYTDFEHGQSDEIRITFEDSELLWQSSWIPSKGDVLTLSIGYEGQKLLNCGKFEIDELEYETPPDTITVKALATSIKKPLRQKNSIAYENKSLKQIASEIAKKHNLKLVGNIADVKIQRITQNQQKDLEFLKNLAEEYGYIFKITSDKLVFYETEKLKSASVTKIFYKKDLSRISLSEKTSQKYKAVQVSYHNPKTGKTVKTTVKNPGVVNGDTLKISTRCENKQQAILKAKAASTSGDTGIEGSIELIGNQYLVAGINIELKGIGHFSGKYHVSQAHHTIDKSVGFKTILEVKSC